MTRIRFGLLTAAVVAMVVLFSYLAREYTVDDALIYYRYVDNVLEGRGLVYNEGERINALTSPFYLYMLIVLGWLFGDVILAGTVLGGVSLILTSLVVSTLYERKGSPLPSILVPLLLASSFYLYRTFGMETILTMFLVLLALSLYRSHRYNALGIVSALLLLTRGESIFLLLGLMLLHFLDRRPFPSAKAFILPALILAGHFLFNLLYFQSLLPQTLGAKISQGKSGLWGEFPVFLNGAGHILDTFTFSPHPRLFYGVFLILAFIGLLSHLRTRRVLQGMAIFLVGYTGFFVFLNIPNYHWYYSIYLVALFLFAGYGMDALVKRLSGASSPAVRRVGGPLLAAAAVLLLSLQVHDTFRRLPVLTERDRIYLEHYRDAGIWLKRHTPEAATVACYEIGHVGWYSQRYIVDILGLVSPPNARYIASQNLSGWLNHYSPDYILVHYPLRIFERGVVPLVRQGRYVVNQAFHVPGLQILEKKTMRP